MKLNFKNKLMCIWKNPDDHRENIENKRPELEIFEMIELDSTSFNDNVMSNLLYSIPLAVGME